MTTVGRWSPNKVRKRLLDDTWVFPNSGMILMRPTSIVVAGVGATASIGVNGSVTFTSATSLSLNGVFTSGYDNYMIVVRGTSSDDAGAVGARLRTSGTDATAANYALQRVDASSTTVSGGRATSATYTRLMVVDDGLRSGGVAYIYGPNLAQPTAFRSVSASAYLDAFIRDWASTHSLSTAYDGITLANEFASTTLTGLVSVYGLGG